MYSSVSVPVSYCVYECIYVFLYVCVSMDFSCRIRDPSPYQSLSLSPSAVTHFPSPAFLGI